MFDYIIFCSPFKCRATNHLRLTLDQEAQEEFQSNYPIDVIVGDLLEEFNNLNFDTQFLVKFTYNTFLKGLIWLAFSTRKLPQAGQMLTGRSLSYKKFLLAKNQPSCDVDGLTGQCSCK